MNSPKTGTGDLIISVQALTPFRIPKIYEDNKIKREIEKITKKITKTKSQNPTKNTKPLETQIDQLVYKLYNLTKKEINLIETSTK